MIFLSVVLYVLLAGVLLMGKPLTQRIAMTLSTCLSSFFAYYFFAIDYFATAIYFIMGIVSIFFFWVCTGEKNKTQKKKGITLFITLILGWIGAHRVYLNQKTLALFYVLFCWTGLTIVFMIIDLLFFAFISDEQFNKKHNTNDVVGKSEINPKNKPIAHNDFDAFNVNSNAVNERNGDELNYNDIRLCGFQAKAKGNIEDFVITVYKDGKTYNFKVKDGDITAVRSSNMRNTKTYEVAQ